MSLPPENSKEDPSNAREEIINDSSGNTSDNVLLVCIFERSGQIRKR